MEDFEFKVSPGISVRISPNTHTQSMYTHTLKHLWQLTGTSSVRGDQHRRGLGIFSVKRNLILSEKCKVSFWPSQEFKSPSIISLEFRGPSPTSWFYTLISAWLRRSITITGKVISSSHKIYWPISASRKQNLVNTNNLSKTTSRTVSHRIRSNRCSTLEALWFLKSLFSDLARRKP